MRFFFKIVIILIFLFVFSCTWVYTIIANNNTDQRITVIIEKDSYDGAEDGTAYLLEPYSSIDINSHTFVFINYIRDTELRTIITFDQNGEIIEVGRISTGYLVSKDFLIEFPLYRLDYNLSRKYLKGKKEGNFDKALPDYIKIQYHYNKKNYSKCLKIIKNITIEKLWEFTNKNFSSSGNKESYVSAISRGFWLIGFLSAIKADSVDLASYYWDKLESNYPDYCEYLLENDIEVLNFKEKIP